MPKIQDGFQLFLKYFFMAALCCMPALLGACTLAPTYQRPDAPIPNTYAVGGDTTNTPNMPWKDFFKDKNMQRLIEIALINNRDLRVAMLNIEKTRAQYQIQRADILPTVDGAAASNSQRLPADLSPTGIAGVSRQYSAGLGFSSFELDLFGRIRSLTDKAIETVYSVENDAQTARLSLVAEVAAMYLQLVSEREFYELTRATYQNRKGELNLISRKFNAGVASELEVSQSRSIMEEARTDLARHATQIGKNENALALLLGAPIPADLPKVTHLSQVAPLSNVPAGLPADLLERRPDIQAAEHILKSANANIGAARANFFPSIRLTGNLGTISADYNNLFSGGAGTWSFLPQVNIPLFDTGRNIAFLDMSEAEKGIAVARYEKAIQTGFREVGDALVQRSNIGEQIAAQTSLVKATRKTYDLASARYDVGVDSYLNVLDAQRSLYNAESGLITTKLLREANALTLYKALGGGWH